MVIDIDILTLPVLMKLVMHFIDFIMRFIYFFIFCLPVSSKILYIHLSSSTTPITAMKKCVMLGHQFNLMGFVFHRSTLITINRI